jgi:hypothetical protein
VVHGVLITPLPFRDADALVSLKHTWKTANGAPPVGIALSLLGTVATELPVSSPESIAHREAKVGG